MSSHVELYLNQVETLMSVNLEDHRVYLQLRHENNDKIRNHNESLDSTTQELTLVSGRKIVTAASEVAPSLGAWERRTSHEVVELFDRILPRDRDWDHMFPGVVSYNIKEKTLNVQVTERNFLQCKTQQLKMGKYLRRLDRYTDTEINNYANAFKSALLRIENAELSLAHGSDEIVDVYERGPNSCMSGSCWDSASNPVQVYGTPDIACAYVEVEGDIKARALVNLIDNQYSTMYGNDALLEPLLDGAGYESGNLDGCRILRLPMGGDTYIMPYIDDANGVSVCSDDDYFIVGGYDYACSSTAGLNVEGISCPGCGDTFDPEYDGIWVEPAETSYCCESCAQEDGYIEAITDTQWDTYEWVCDSDAYYCRTDNQYYTNYDDLVEVDGDFYKHDDDTIVYSDDQDEYIFMCDAVYIDDIDSWVDDNRESEFAEEDDDEYEDPNEGVCDIHLSCISSRSAAA